MVWTGKKTNSNQKQTRTRHTRMFDCTDDIVTVGYATI